MSNGLELKNAASACAQQKTVFESGNEMAAMAAAPINYHIMGSFSITPSTEIAQYLDMMKTRGEHDIRLIPADGEHGSAGICYGAAAAGARVFNATSANGFLYMIEQLPVQAGTRFPMVMNLVTRAVSGPLDIRGDHSDLYYGLNAGWIILTARSPQAVYDMNIMALRIAEHAEVQLPVIVAYDGFFTSHQKRKVQIFADGETVRQFVGEKPPEFPHVLDPERPVVVGAYMNGDDLVNNHYQQSNAMLRAGEVFREVAGEYAALSGRSYGALDLYRMEDAEVALFLLNSAAESAKDVADRLRAQGVKAGVISPNIIRPFPAAEIREALYAGFFPDWSCFSKELKAISSLCSIPAAPISLQPAILTILTSKASSIICSKMGRPPCPELWRHFSSRSGGGKLQCRMTLPSS